MQSRVGALSKFLIIDLLGSLVWFPVWWYTIGLKRVVIGSIHAMQNRWKEHGLGIWLRNFFVPMYGEYDWSGRLISLFVRLAVLIGRLIALFVEAMLYVVGLLLWIGAPIIFGFLVVTNAVRGMPLTL